MNQGLAYLTSPPQTPSLLGAFVSVSDPSQLPCRTTSIEMLAAKSFKRVLPLLVAAAVVVLTDGAKAESRTHPCFHDDPTNNAKTSNLQNGKRTCDPHRCSVLAMEIVLNASNTKGKQGQGDDVEVLVRREIRVGSSQKTPQKDQPTHPSQLDWTKVENNGLVEFVDCVPKGQDYELSLYTSTGLKDLPLTSNTPPGAVKHAFESPGSQGSFRIKIRVDDETALWEDDEMAISSELFFRIGRTRDATREMHQVEVLDFTRRHTHAREHVGPRSLKQVRIRMDSFFSF